MAASAPASFGAYDVVEELGHGSFGWVYRARHRATGAERALKVIRHDDADPAATERFRREAEALARVDGHPNLVRVHEAGVAGRCLYYAMELVAGPSLRSLLRKGPLRPTEAARLMGKVARALAHCHARGLVHRDVKPENILLAETEDGLEPKLADLGLVRDAMGSRLTMTGEIVGTPAYMSPEQARAERVDGKADVYGLAAVLYELLSGRRAHDGRTATEVLEKVQQQAAPPLASVAADVPLELARIVDVGLERDPVRRPSAADLASWLEAFATRAAKGTVKARPSGARRALGATVALGIGAVGAVGLSFALRERLRRPAAPVALSPAEALLEANRRLRAAKLQSSPLRERIEAAREAARLAAGDAATRGDAQELCARLLLEDKDEAGALESARESLATSPTDERRLLVASVATRTGAHEQALEVVAPLLSGPKARVEAYRIAAASHLAAGRIEQADRLAREGLEKLGRDSRLLVLRARSLRKLGKRDEALKLPLPGDAEARAERSLCELETLCATVRAIAQESLVSTRKVEVDAHLRDVLVALAEGVDRLWQDVRGHPDADASAVVGALAHGGDLMGLACYLGTPRPWDDVAARLVRAFHLVVPAGQERTEADGLGRLCVASAAIGGDISLADEARPLVKSMSPRGSFQFHVALGCLVLDTGRTFATNTPKIGSDMAAADFQALEEQACRDLDTGLALCGDKSVVEAIGSEITLRQLYRTSVQLRMSLLWRGLSSREPTTADLERCVALGKNRLDVPSLTGRDEFPPLLNVVPALLLLGRLDEAERSIEALENEGFLAECCVLRGDLALRRGQLDEAARLFERANSLDKGGRSDAWAGLAIVHAKKGQGGRAREALMSAGMRREGRQLFGLVYLRQQAITLVAELK